MKQYFVEGLFIPRKSLKRVPPGKKPAPGDLEPFSGSFWANDPAEALQLASAALDGGRWLETPRVSLTSEEQRMRQAGAPELPGFAAAASARVKKKGKPARR